MIRLIGDFIALV